MSGSVEVVSLAGLLGELDRVVDALHSVSLTGTTDDELLAVQRRLERIRRKLAPVDYRLINETVSRGIPDQHGCRSAGQFLRLLLSVDPGEANARVRAAEAAGPRATLTGEQLPPVFEHVAQAQASGDISQRHALLIEKTIDDLPDAVQAAEGEQVERDLVNYAGDFDPKRLAVIARRTSDYLDPDGILTEPADHQRRRGFTIRDRADGSSTMTIEATAELTARMLTCLDVFARPRPAGEDGLKDTRTIAQRQHDGLGDLLEFAQRFDDAPSNNGVSMTVVVTMTTEQYSTGTGLARTGHGALVPVSEALSWSGGDAEVFAVVLDSMNAITHYSDTHRIFSRNQRLAMGARDGGCTFPGCPEPPGRCQTDHVTRWEHGGRTRVDVGAMECRYHHREAEQHGWKPVMLNGRPHWIPPAWIDPTQRPRRNTLHDTAPAA